MGYFAYIINRIEKLACLIKKNLNYSLSRIEITIINRNINSKRKEKFVNYGDRRTPLLVKFLKCSLHCAGARTRALRGAKKNKSGLDFYLLTRPVNNQVRTYFYIRIDVTALRVSFPLFKNVMGYNIHSDRQSLPIECVMSLSEYSILLS